MIFRKISFLITVFFSINVFAQVQTTSDISKMDTIFFLNGEVKSVKVVDTVYHLIRFLPEKRKKKPHVMDVEKDRVFSLKFSDGQEHIMYFHDSTIGNIFTVLEAKMFMLGEQEATKNFKGRWSYFTGFVAGIIFPIVLSNAVVLSPLPALATTPVVYIPQVRINTKAIANKKYLQYDTYLMGYEKVARKKLFVHALIGAGAGLAAGFGAWAIIKY
ncbi:MAG: hypothetical protein AABZ32_00045 [Bacteroidota bacterium]